MTRLIQLKQWIVIRIILPFLTCTVYSPLIIIGLLLKSPKMAGYCLNAWGKTCMGLIGHHYVIEGLEHIDLNRRFLIISNHGSLLDIPLNSILFKVPLCWVLKEELLRVPIVNIMFLLGIGIPISRSNARKSTEKMIKTIAHIRKQINPNIIIYPEGTRTKTGEIQPFKRGFVTVMRNYEMDILPITLSGVVNFFSYKQKIPNSKSIIKVIVHPPIDYNTLKDLDDKTITQQIQEKIASVYYP